MFTRDPDSDETSSIRLHYGTIGLGKAAIHSYNFRSSVLAGNGFFSENIQTNSSLPPGLGTIKNLMARLDLP